MNALTALFCSLIYWGLGGIELLVEGCDAIRRWRREKPFPLVRVESRATPKGPHAPLR
jgi:hypothetical protein